MVFSIHVGYLWFKVLWFEGRRPYGYRYDVWLSVEVTLFVVLLLVVLSSNRSSGTDELVRHVLEM